MKNIGKADCELIKLLQTFALLCLLLFLLHRYESSAKHIKKAFFFLHSSIFPLFLSHIIIDDSGDIVVLLLFTVAREHLVVV